MRIKLLFTIVSAALLTSCGSNLIGHAPTKPILPKQETPELPAPFTAENAAFNPTGSHIQGIAVSEDAVYASQAQHLTKIDWKGKHICSTSSINHTGDICWYNGELYAALALDDALAGPDAGPDGTGKIQVFDKDLKLVREVTVNRRTDGITCLDGILYVGMGSKTQPSQDAHRVNILGRFDARSLKEIAPRAEFDYGYDTNYGFQDISNDGKYIYASFYAASKGTPAIAVFDKNLKIVKTWSKSCSNGFDLMPERFAGKKKIFIVAKTSKTSQPAAVNCSFDYWTPEE